LLFIAFFIDYDKILVAETLASVLNRTSALLPTALFASLGMPKADEGIVDAKLVGQYTTPHCSSIQILNQQGIDQELKRACETVIAHCADLAARPLRDWSARVRVVVSTSANKSAVPAQLASQDWASVTAIQTLEAAFCASCERELRNAAARMRLYLEDERTVGVLLMHARERILAEWGDFAVVVREVHDQRVRVMDEATVGGLLRRACEEEAMGQQAGSSTG
jgi:conserved oligomeric Golgi complex subunit 3